MRPLPVAQGKALFFSLNNSILLPRDSVVIRSDLMANCLLSSPFIYSLFIGSCAVEYILLRRRNQHSWKSQRVLHTYRQSGMSHKYSTAWLTSHTQHTAHATLAQSQDIVQITVYTYNVWTTVAPVLFFHAWRSGGREVLDGGVPHPAVRWPCSCHCVRGL